MMRRRNVLLIDRNCVLTIVGNTLQFLNLLTKTVTWKEGKFSGLGAFCLHPSREYLAVGAKGEYPAIEIYKIGNYDEPYKRLEKGAIAQYATLNFDKDGDKLASIAGAPDYMLTIWDWKKQSIVLRTKAFGQDVFNVSFSPYTDSDLTTSGSGHIKFWKMAETFTGLKLQGQIGKFGKMNISDIAAYAELPDGKVLSGSETGDLLLWEGNLIKCIFSGSSGSGKCHDGAIELVRLENNEFITAGVDGYVRFWAFEKIDSAEPSDSSNIIDISPTSEVKIGQPNEPAKIYSLEMNGDSWFVQDNDGAYWKVDRKQTIQKNDYDEEEPVTQYSSTKLLECHSGNITGIACAPNDHVLVSCGVDGSVRMWDYIAKKQRYFSKFNSQATCLIWDPIHVDQTGLHITVGFYDGVVRKLKRSIDGFERTKIFKPHSKPITAMEYSSTGDFVTASEDSTIFLFSAQLEPLGFCRLPAVAKSVAWNKDGTQILIGLQNGSILELERPTTIRLNQTYEFSPKFKTYFYFQKQKPEPKPKLEEKPKEEEDEESKEINEEENNDEENNDEEKEEPPVPVTRVMYSKQGVYVSLQKEGSVFQYSGIWWIDPSHTVAEYPEKLLCDHSAICTFLNYSASGNSLFLGFSDGIIRVIDLTAQSWQVKQMKQIHDMFSGSITQVCTSYDESHIFSADISGCLFVRRNLQKEFLEVQGDNKPQLALCIQSIPDITDKNVWSIQEEKLKSEEEKKNIAVEGKKMLRRKKIEHIKHEFAKLLLENNKLDDNEKLGRDALQIDPKFKDTIEAQFQEKLTIMHKELEWESEKINLQLGKIQNNFFSNLEVERIVLTSFKNNKCVSSFRTIKIYPELQEQIDKIHLLINERLQKSGSMRIKSDKVQINNEPNEQTDYDIRSARSIKTRESSKSSKKENRMSAKVETQEDLLQQRSDRAIERIQLLQHKPQVDNDAQHEKDIEKAKKSIGSYMLKSDPHFVIPENQRSTTEKKLLQMVLLEESLFTLKMAFNTRLLALRDLKVRLVDKFKKYAEQINDINWKLNITEKLVPPAIDDMEFPENREKISKEEILQYEQQKIKEEKRKKRMEEAKAKGVSAFDDDDENVNATEGKSKSIHSGYSKKSSNKSSIRGKDLSAKGRADMERQAKSAGIAFSQMELNYLEMEKQKNLNEKQKLLTKMENQIQSFDDAVEELRREKIKLQGDLKLADLRLLLLFNELELLREFEMKDSNLINDLNTKRQEKLEYAIQISACQDKLAGKKREIEELCKQENVLKQFMELVQETHPAFEQLLKIFKNSKSEGTGDQSDSESDSESDDLEEEEEEELDQIPEKCDQKIFEGVLQLRRKRVTQEKQLEGIAKSVETLKRDRERLIKQEKSVDLALKGIEMQMEDVQREKQRKLNELTTVVILKLSQIQSLVQNKIPSDLSNHVVFTNGGLVTLSHRIKELKQEKRQLKEAQVELQRKLLKEHKERKQHDQILAEWQHKVKEVQLLKFGEEVDLEELEDASIDHTTEELKKHLAACEKEAEETLQEWQKQITDSKDKFMKATQENTELMQKMAALREQQLTLENELDKAQTTIVSRIQKGATKGSKIKEPALTGLKSKAINQAKGIDEIKNEIALLRSKSTHVYVP